MKETNETKNFTHKLPFVGKSTFSILSSTGEVEYRKGGLFCDPSDARMFEEIIKVLSPNKTADVEYPAIPFVKYPLSKEGDEIIDFMLGDNKENLFVNATAGSGKTYTTVVYALHEAKRRGLLSGKEVCVLCMTRNIRFENVAKLKGIPNASITNFHGLCYSGMAKAHGRPNVQGWKVNNLVRKMFPVPKQAKKKEVARILINNDALVKLIDFVMVSQTNPTNEIDVKATLCHYLNGICHYRMQGNLDHNALVERVPAVMAEMAKDKQNITFTEMIYYAINDDSIVLPQFDWVFVDECQDMSPLIHDLIVKITKKGARIFVSGDQKQSIMGFAGASQISCEVFKDRFGCVEKNMWITRRCSKAICKAVNEEFGLKMIPMEDAEEGDVFDIDISDFGSNLTPEDMVLVRRNMDGVSAFFYLYRLGVKATLVGGDALTETLLKAMFRPYRNLQTKTFNSLKKAVASEVSKLSEADTTQEDADMMVCIDSILSQSKTFKDAVRHIFSLTMVKKDAVRIMTVHKAKGAEARDVYQWESAQGFRVSFNGQQEWELAEEENLDYVAKTRGKRNHINVTFPSTTDDTTNKGVGNPDRALAVA